MCRYLDTLTCGSDYIMVFVLKTEQKEKLLFLSYQSSSSRAEKRRAFSPAS